MNVTFKLDEKDYIDFNYWYSRKVMLWVNIFYSIMITGILLLILIDHRLVKLSIILPLSLLVLLLVFFNTITYFRAKNIWRSDSFLQKEQTYNITSESISVTTERSSAIIQWDEVYSFAESKDCYYIFIAKIKAYMLPKRFLGDAAAQELIQLATSNLPPKKVKLRK